jgi:hypothetical protein
MLGPVYREGCGLINFQQEKNRARVDPAFPGGAGIPGPDPAAGSLVLCLGNIFNISWPQKLPLP